MSYKSYQILPTREVLRIQKRLVVFFGRRPEHLRPVMQTIVNEKEIIELNLGVQLEKVHTMTKIRRAFQSQHNYDQYFFYVQYI